MIYLDNNATTKPAPEVIDAVVRELALAPANPSSVHTFGQAAKRRLNQYRETIAGYLEVAPHEIIFTSGGTESMNLLLRGKSKYAKTGHVISSAIEHSCVYHTLIDLQRSGIDVTFLTPSKEGYVSVTQIQEAIRPDTFCICLFAVNSETGVKHDLTAIGALAKQRHIDFFVDGVAWLGKELLHIPAGVTGIGFSGHKIHAPQGTGFIFLKSGSKLEAGYTGALQEYGLRPGTENLPGIAGLSQAVFLLKSALPAAQHTMRHLRDLLQTELVNLSPGAIVHGGQERICNILNISFERQSGEEMLIALDMAGVAVSHGSACASGALEPSRVLTRMGIPFAQAKSALRFSLSRYTTEEEIYRTIEIIRKLL